MKSKVLLSLGVYLSLFMMGCKEDEPVNPNGLQVTMKSNSQMLVEGGQSVEVIVELDRTYNEIKYLYLDYGAKNGEYPNFFESALRKDSIEVKVQNEARRVLRIPFLAGEQQKVIRLHATENDLYRGSRPLELKVLSYEQGWVQHKAEMQLSFEEKTPRPVFGILDSKAAETMVIASKDGSTQTLILPISVAGRFQFPQTIQLTYSGTAKAGSDFEKIEMITIGPNDFPALHTMHLALLNVYVNRDFSSPKTIQITLSQAEEGEIANGQEFQDHTGEKVTLHDTYSLTVRE